MHKLQLDLEALELETFNLDVAMTPVYNTYWCTAPSSVGPNVCGPTDALGC
jgi:hypothetical protein